MRNLWLLLLRNHTFLLFVVAEVAALGWVSSSHAYPRGHWIRLGLSISGTWGAWVTQFEEIGRLSDSNELLLAENAALREKLLTYEWAHRRSSDPDSVKVKTYPISDTAQAAHRVQVRPASVLRATWNRSSNVFVLDRGSKDGILPESGVIADGCAMGRVVEVAEEFTLVLPLIHTELEWSARVKRRGPVARLVWDGKNPTLGQLLDVPRSTALAVGDTIWTTGLQDMFPAGIPMARILAFQLPDASEFYDVTVEFAADFKQLRYVEVIHSGPQATAQTWMDPAP
jgi:rod shape-determining protein MreC